MLEVPKELLLTTKIKSKQFLEFGSRTISHKTQNKS